jgi:uncharacterized protein (TIGR02117 family)
MLGKALAHTIAGLAICISLFLLAAWAGSSVARNADWEEPAKGIDIMIGTNGVHTGIVMPIASDLKDWREEFAHTDQAAPDWPYTHVMVSFGEREVFLNTPTWRDLTPLTAFFAAIGGDGLLHAAFFVRPAPDENFRTIRVSAREYSQIVQQIEGQLGAASPRSVFPGYGNNDAFYDSNLTYHLGNTCNQWTSDTLAAAGVKTGLWTPLSGGVMKWVARRNLGDPERETRAIDSGTATKP